MPTSTRLSNCPDRPWHILRPVKGECVPRRAIVFQVAPLRRQIRQGIYEDTLLCGHARCYDLEEGAIACERGVDFGRPEQLWNAIGRWQIPDRRTWIFAHSLAYQLTLLDFWRRLDAAGERHVWSVLSDPPTILCTRRGRRILQYVDTANYFREPLPSLLGGREGWSSWALDPGASVYDQVAWCRRASGALGDLMCRVLSLWTRELKSTWQSTAASLAWTVYRHWYMAEPVWVHGHERASRLELEALHGGLLWVPKLGAVAEPVEAWDVNSLYPYVMASQNYPHKLARYFEEPSIPQLHALLEHYFCVADVHVEVPPYCLPYRCQRLAGFSRAAGRYVLCGQELVDCVRLGLVTGVHRLATYECADLFGAFVADLYPRKLRATIEGDVAGRWLWKMILNGLSGKFAQRSRRWKDAKEILSPGRWKQWWHRDYLSGRAVRARSIAGRPQLLAEGGLKRDSLPVVTSAITSAGRTKIRAYQTLAGLSSTLYTDCDSLHLLPPGANALADAGVCDPRRLGALKLVARGDDAYYWGPKHYRLGDYFVSNVVQIGAHKLDDGYWLQQTKRGLERTLQSGVLDRVLVRDQEVKIDGFRVTTRTAIL